MSSNLIIAVCVFISAIQPVLSEPTSLPGARLNFMSRRQADEINPDTLIPTQCTTPCQPVLDAVSTAACANDHVTCLCTSTLATAFRACLECAVAHGALDVTQGLVDSDIAALNEACSAAGTPISIDASSSSSSSSIFSSSSSSSSRSNSSSSSSSTGAAATQTNGGSTGGTATGSESTTTPAPDTGAGAGGGSSTSTTSAVTTSATSSALRLSGSIVGAVFAALLLAGTSLVFAV
ncbi:hypothetical protein BJ912DRAFT_87028 [Pholiota molesta]|nr:hypothetical protein BJ912DRAFT_87028 [Pholiota molesta]